MSPSSSSASSGRRPSSIRNPSSALRHLARSWEGLCPRTKNRSERGEARRATCCGKRAEECAVFFIGAITRERLFCGGYRVSVCESCLSGRSAPLHGAGGRSESPVEPSEISLDRFSRGIARSATSHSHPLPVQLLSPACNRACCPSTPALPPDPACLPRFSPPLSLRGTGRPFCH